MGQYQQSHSPELDCLFCPLVLFQANADALLCLASKLRVLVFCVYVHLFFIGIACVVVELLNFETDCCFIYDYKFTKNLVVSKSQSVRE